MAATHECNTSQGCGTEQLPIFAVGQAGVFWALHLLSWDLRGLNVPQYIFHASLPPLPCDAELPCQGAGEVCGATGLCQPE